MNKGDLINEVAEKTGLSKKDATAALNAVLDGIIKGTKKGGVAIAGFGSFVVAKRKARKGINPQTGESIAIKASKVPKFRAAQAFKAAV